MFVCPSIRLCICLCICPSPFLSSNSCLVLIWRPLTGNECEWTATGSLVLSGADNASLHLLPFTPHSFSSLSHPPLVAEPGLSMGLTPYYTWLRRRTVCVCLSVVCLSRQTFTRRHALSDESTAKPMTSHHSTKARNGTLPAY